MLFEQGAFDEVQASCFAWTARVFLQDGVSVTWKTVDGYLYIYAVRIRLGRFMIGGFVNVEVMPLSTSNKIKVGNTN